METLAHEGAGGQSGVGVRHPFGCGQVPWISEVVRLPSSRKVNTQHHV